MLLFPLKFAAATMNSSKLSCAFLSVCKASGKQALGDGVTCERGGEREGVLIFPTGTSTKDCRVGSLVFLEQLLTSMDQTRTEELHFRFKIQPTCACTVRSTFGRTSILSKIFPISGNDAPP